MTSAARTRGVSELETLGDELVALDLDDAHARERPGREARDPLTALVAEIHDAVDFRRLAGRAALPRERGVFAPAAAGPVVDGPGDLRLTRPRDRVLAFLDDRRPLGRELGRH